MTIIFCLEPLTVGDVDLAYEGEAEAAEAAGFATGLIDFEALTRNGGNAAAATRRIAKAAHPAKALYRGWMLKPTQYEMLYAALLQKNIELVNSPAEYATGHYFPGTYYAIREQTAQSIYFPVTTPVNFVAIHEQLRVFGNRRLIVKDYVKSRKYEWSDACFISAADNRPEVERVVGNFLRRQGEDLNGGLVFREFLDLQTTGEIYPGTDFEAARETRFFIYRGKPFFAGGHRNGQNGNAPIFPDEAIARAAAHVGSNFFTLDVAQTTAGRFVIIEIGDGQVSGLSEEADAREFYELLFLRECL